MGQFGIDRPRNGQSILILDFLTDAVSLVDRIRCS